MHIFRVICLLISFLISEHFSQPKKFENDTKCEQFGSMIIKHIISKEPYPEEFSDLYKLLQFGSTAIGDLGNYYGCQQLSYSKYFVLTAELSGYKQSVGFCYYKECDEVIL